MDFAKSLLPPVKTKILEFYAKIRRCCKSHAAPFDLFFHNISTNLYCSGYWEGGLWCALIKCTLGPGKSEKGWDFGGEGTREQWGTKKSSLQATWDRGGRFLSQLEGAK